MTLTKVVLLVALLVATASASPLIREDLAQISNINRADSEYRLPNNTAPISYDIRLTPYIVVGNFTFDGEAEISLQVLEPTNTITLHTNALTYNEALTTLVSEDGTSQTIISHTYNTALQFLIVEVQNELPVGNYTLSFTFVGLLSLDMYGFYRSSYVNAAGDTVWLATTQFQATAARRAFPCYDEPALKATFNISIKHEPHLHALSNMPIAAQYTDTSDDKVWTTFETTPVMSTYLVAFVVSDYVAIKNADESFNAWSRANAIADSQFIFDIGEVELAELEQYTSVDYTLPKMDQISIPDFSAGAMENWGLVTYRESYFHYNENTSTLATKQDIATVVSHEFAHQWFGNLVGPYWWKYLWLNEGFATYFQYLTTDAVVDNWRLIEQFVIRVQQASAFAYDSSAFSHPMTQDVASPAEINSIFDTISYFKAASVIRMTSHFLTEDVFKAGLTKYLNNKAFGTAVPDDLYDALQEAETEAGVLPFHVYVKNILETWVDQMGYPVVTLTRNYTTGTTEITQERFLLGGTNPADTNEYRWWIPINWATQANPDFSSTAASDWIREQDASIIISGFNVNGWVIFNKQQTGYYRVNYDDTNWGFLSTYLNSDNYANIHVLNRAALIDDAFNLARADRVSYTVVFDLILYLHREVDYIPWFPAYNGLVFVNRLFANTNEYETFRAYLSFLMTDVFETVGIQEAVGDDHTTQLNRVNTINHACSYGLQSCRSSAEARLTAWLDDSAANPISATLLSTTICAGLRGSSPTIWYRALHRYLTTASSTEQTALLAGLGCSEDPDVINAWLDALIEPSTGISIAVAIPAFVSVYQANAYNVDRAFDFIVNNLDRMISYFGSNASIQVFILGISYRMTTPAQLEKLNAFIAAQTEVVGGSATTAIGYVESNIAWNNLHGEEIRTWLRLWAADSEDVSTAQPEPTTQQPTTTTTTTEQAQTTPQEVETTTEEVLTTTEQVQTTTEQVQTTTQQQTTTEQIQTTTEPIQTTTEPIQTTTEQVQTTTEQIQTTTEGSDPAPPEDDSTTVEPDDPVTEESTEGSAATAYLSFFAVIPVFLCMLKVN